MEEGVITESLEFHFVVILRCAESLCGQFKVGAENITAAGIGVAVPGVPFHIHEDPADQFPAFLILEEGTEFVFHVLDLDLFELVAQLQGGEVVKDTLGKAGGDAEAFFVPVIVLIGAPVSGNIPAQGDAEKPRFGEFRHGILAFRADLSIEAHTLSAAGEPVAGIKDIHIVVGDLDPSGEAVAIAPTAADVSGDELFFVHIDRNIFSAGLGRVAHGHIHAGIRAAARFKIVQTEKTHPGDLKFPLIHLVAGLNRDFPQQHIGLGVTVTADRDFAHFILGTFADLIFQIHGMCQEVWFAHHIDPEIGIAFRGIQRFDPFHVLIFDLHVVNVIRHKADQFLQFFGRAGNRTGDLDIADEVGFALLHGDVQVHHFRIVFNRRCLDLDNLEVQIALAQVQFAQPDFIPFQRVLVIDPHFALVEGQPGEPVHAQEKVAGLHHRFQVVRRVNRVAFKGDIVDAYPHFFFNDKLDEDRAVLLIFQNCLDLGPAATFLLVKSADPVGSDADLFIVERRLRGESDKPHEFFPGDQFGIFDHYTRNDRFRNQIERHFHRAVRQVFCACGDIGEDIAGGKAAHVFIHDLLRKGSALAGLDRQFQNTFVILEIGDLVECALGNSLGGEHQRQLQE